MSIDCSVVFYATSAAVIIVVMDGHMVAVLVALRNCSQRKPVATQLLFSFLFLKNRLFVLTASNPIFSHTHEWRHPKIDRHLALKIIL
jgi:hypothetical protein